MSESFDEFFDAIHGENLKRGETHTHTITPLPPSCLRVSRRARLRMLWWRVSRRVRRTPNGWKIRL